MIQRPTPVQIPPRKGPPNGSHHAKYFKMRASHPPSLVPQKRPRPVKSCLSCRNRKLKCDREQPCAQCIKIGRGHECVFDERAGSLGRVSDDTTSPPQHGHGLPPIRQVVGQYGQQAAQDAYPTPANEAELIELQTRIKKLEHMLERRDGPTGGGGQMSTPLPEHLLRDGLRDGVTEDAAERPSHKYSGLHNTRSLLSLFPDASTVVSAILHDPATRPSLQSLPTMFPKVEPDSTPTSFPTLHSLLSIIPPHEQCVQLISAYTLHVEGVFQVLHLPTFLDQYDRFVDPTKEKDSKFLANFTPALALVSIIGSQLRSVGHSWDILSVSRKQCAIVEWWLMSLRGKQRLQIATTQSLCLLALCKLVLATSANEVWRLTGELVRLALSQGLHKDPEEIDSAMPPLQAKLRRRLWFTTIELDLHASITINMPAAILAVDYTCKPPSSESSSNSNEVSQAIDETYDECTIVFQNALLRSLPQRIRANRLMCSANPTINEAKNVVTELEGFYTWLNTVVRSEPWTTSPAQLFRTSTLDMCFRKPMVSLYTMFLQTPGMNELITRPTVLSQCVALCMSTVSLLEAFDPENAEHELLDNDRLWQTFQALHGDDIVRAAYCACLAMKMITNPVESADQRARPVPLQYPLSAARRMIEEMIKTFIKRQTDLRPNLKQLLALALVIECTKPGLNEISKEKRMRDAFHRTVQLCHERNHSDQANIQGLLHIDTYPFTGADDLNLAELLVPEFNWTSPFQEWNLGFQSGPY